MTVPYELQKTVHLPQGFAFSAVTAGIKASGRPDLVLAEATSGANAAAVFTKNLVAAAPVEVGRAALAASGGRVRAVVVNSGNANCATGKPGLAACRRICREAGKLLGAPAEEIFPSSTGIIGVPLPAEKILVALPRLVQGRQASEEAARHFAHAILTTDTVPKFASTQIFSGKKTVHLLGIAKGSGMIHPQMATMLVYIFCDIAASPAELKKTLREAADRSFNSMSVDGDTSTNDTVLLLASGLSGVRLREVQAKFGKALLEVCQSLADQIICDGEGVQHVIRLSVEQARSREEAMQIARTVAHSLLVKTAWAGADPNWGRILAAVGRAGVKLDPNRVSIYIGEQLVCRNGVAARFDEKRAHSDLSQAACGIRIQLKRGRESAIFTTTDLTTEYVHINADYST
jgi:glutamate N-acetyltransferase/amino-acid N-acetyltransferase